MAVARKLSLRHLEPPVPPAKNAVVKAPAVKTPIKDPGTTLGEKRE